MYTTTLLLWGLGLVSVIQSIDNPFEEYSSLQQCMVEGVVGAAPSPEDPGVIVFDWQPGIDPRPLPACTADNGCVMQCKIDEADDVFKCKDGTGAAISLTLGTASTETDITGRKSLLLLANNAHPPSIPAVTANSVLGSIWPNNHTVITTGHSTRVQNTVPYVFRHLDTVSTGNGMQIRGESGNRCMWHNSSASPNSLLLRNSATVPYGHVDGWAISTCRKNSTTYTSRVNGESLDGTWAASPASPSAATLAQIGKNSINGYSFGGHFQSITVYNRALTDSELDLIEDSYFGLVPAVSQTANPVSYVRASILAAPLNNTYYPMAKHFPLINSSGLLVEERNNQVLGGALFATDTLDVNSWTSVGTPTINVNTLAGPFDPLKDRSTAADRIIDDDAAAFEGKQSPTSCGTVKDRYTYSYWLRQGDTGVTTDKARITIDASTGITTCDVSLTSTWTRYSCSATIATNPTFVRSTVSVGNVASETGSIFVAQAQCNRDGWTPESATTNNTNSAFDDVKISKTEVSAWGSDSLEISVVFIPEFTWATDVFIDGATSDDSFYLFDLFQAGETSTSLAMRQMANAQPSLITTSSGAVVNTTTGATVVSVEAGATYAFRVRYEPDGTGKYTHDLYFDECLPSDRDCVANTLIASSIDNQLPTLSRDGVQVGCRYDNTLCTASRILRIQVTDLDSEISAIATGLFAYWDYSNSYIDSHAAKVLSPSGPPQTFPTGLNGLGYRQDSNVNYTSLALPPDHNNSAGLGVSLWIKFDGAPVHGGLLAKTGFLADQGDWSISVQPSGVVAARLNNMAVSLESSSAIAASTWTHVAVTYEGTELKIYLNGSIAGSTSVVTTIDNNHHQLIVGSYYSVLYGTYGSVLDSVGYWQRSLTSDEVLFLYRSGQARAYRDL